MLPYATIQEAETAVGRPLTAAETIWFNFSATKSDFFLHCDTILFLFLIYSFVPFFYIFLQLVFSNNIRKYKIQPRVQLSFSDSFRCYRDVVREIILFLCPFQLLSYPLLQFTGIRTSLPLPSTYEIVAQLTMYLVIEDYSNYWIHRFLHCKWGYEKIHKVHHEYSAPIGYSYLYAHWAEILLISIPTFLGPVMVPGHMITWWLWVALRQIEAIENHSGYDLPWNPTKYIPFYGGAEYHDYHHRVGGQTHSNFASVFTYCDYIYGTDKGYRYQKKVLQQLKEGSEFSSEQKDLKSD